MSSATDAPRMLADPRPLVVDDGGRHLLAGARCVACGHALALPLSRCTRCGGEVEPAHFGPAGTLWAVTVLHVPARPDDEVPYTLGYVDLDDGPRLLARVDDGAGEAHVGTRVALTASTAAGNPAVEVVA